MITRIEPYHGKGKKDVEHDDLKPCPFCGGIAWLTRSGSAWVVCCTKCFAKSCYQDLPSRWNSSKCLDTHLIKKVVKAWNKRA